MTRQKKKPSDYPSVSFRISQPVHELLLQQADLAGRSKNERAREVFLDGLLDTSAEAVYKKLDTLTQDQARLRTELAEMRSDVARIHRNFEQLIAAIQESCLMVLSDQKDKASEILRDRFQSYPQ